MITFNDQLTSLPETVVLAVVNEGYVKTGMVENWYVSACRAGIGDNVLVAALDGNALARLYNRHIPSVLWETDSVLARGAQLFRKGGWQGIVLEKLHVVHALLKSGRTVVFSDVDITFRHNPIPFLEESSASVLIQSDVTRTDIPHGQLRSHSICSGFYMARPDPEILPVWNLDEDAYNRWPGDQPLLRYRLHKLPKSKWAVLPPQLFPSGEYWRTVRPVDPVLIHFNWCEGTGEKVNRMKEAQTWNLETEGKSTGMNIFS